MYVIVIVMNDDYYWMVFPGLLPRDSHTVSCLQIFGIAPWYTWPLPIDPIFDDYDRVVGFTMPQRLDRERQFCEAKRPLPDIRTAQSLELPRCVNDLLPV
jgi:hypothetical protein